MAVWPSWPQIKLLRGNVAANKIIAWPPPQTVILNLISLIEDLIGLTCIYIIVTEMIIFKGHKGVLKVVIRLGYMG